MSHPPAAPGYKPTTDEMLRAWFDARPLKSVMEKIEMEVGFYEWLDEQR